MSLKKHHCKNFTFKNVFESYMYILAIPEAVHAVANTY